MRPGRRSRWAHSGGTCWAFRITTAALFPARRTQERSEGSPATDQFGTGAYEEEACCRVAHLRTDDVLTSEQRLTVLAQRRRKRATGTGSWEVYERKKKQCLQPRFLDLDWFRANV